MDPQNSQTPICCDLPHQLASAIHVSTVASKHNHKLFRGRLSIEMYPCTAYLAELQAQVNIGCCSTSKCIHSNNYLIICTACWFPFLSGSTGSNPRGVQAPSPSPLRSTGTEEEADEDERGSRHYVEQQDEEQEEHGEHLPAPRRRRGGASREISSLIDYNSSGPSLTADRGTNSI